jgi:hypothetical protein
MPNNCFLLGNYVNRMFDTRAEINHELISTEFMALLKDTFSDDEFKELLIYSGYIPDSYSHDSSEETLFTKLIEALVCEWARRMGFEAELIKQKSSVEDVKITINSKVIVCDAKSFRLGRSQQAPNAKDFLKLEDVRKWMARYENAIGGLVTYPCTHEWKAQSDIYQYCSTKDAPTLMLPYKYLSYLLHIKDTFNPHDLLELWNYGDLFPEPLPKNIKGGNKLPYWHKINLRILEITGQTNEQFREYMLQSDSLIRKCIQANLETIMKLKDLTIENVKKSISMENDIEKLKQIAIEYQIETETELLNKIINRIRSFRL